MERIVIFYHGGCLDGFGGAYAAWKKFGDGAEYVPLSRGEEPPYDVAAGAHAYFIDFVYAKDVMARFLEVAAHVTALDHHEGAVEDIRSVPDHVYETEHSGAGIAWKYFHPDAPVPSIVAYAEDIDLYRFALPETRAIITYLEVQPMNFAVWDEITRKLDDPTLREEMLQKARTYAEYFQLLVDQSVDHAKLVSFEGQEVYFGTTHPMKSMKSLVGNLLAKKQGPFALVVSAHPSGYGVSIRGDGTVDVSKIAQKYGGNGHPNSAGFLIPREGPFPWTLIEHDEAARD
ncbi:MAG TPA: hypothetical protein VEA36_02985 [Candidatus Paceibacterota bacterium]|nr:hypothetical protein [Candidatus Paceibacterota bacterium]